MISSRRAAFAIVAIAFAGAGCAQAPAPRADMKMADADMTVMMACHKMPHAEMTKNERCASMMKMHSGMMSMKTPS